MLGDSAKCIGIGVRSRMEKYGVDYVFSNIKKELRGDIVFGNLECVLSDKKYMKNNFSRAQMIGTPSCVDALKHAGFNSLNVANNHTMQHGAEGFNETCNILKKNGFYVIGIRGRDGYTCLPEIIEINNAKIGLLGYSLTKENYEKKELLYASGSIEDILEDVEKIKNICDYLIVSVHWGDEFVHVASKNSKEIGAKLLACGVDLVLGHHSHTPQEICVKNTSNIFYGLGNFVSDMIWDSKLRNSLIYKATVKNLVVTKQSIISCFIDSNYRVVKKEELTLDEYIEKFKNIWENEKLIEYEELVEKMRIRNRNLSHIYVIKNFHKYKSLVFLKILTNSIMSLYNGYKWKKFNKTWVKYNEK
ncbi:poly-gamma-glutamate capsule biosynthesis protein [Desulfuromonas sp. AOP6]|nr:poly-gamma-glutamate capsule biosynthesis protein [Desulfuromonas sp. AOP6]